MSDNDLFKLIFALMLILGASAIAGIRCYNTGYRAGQVDALTGKVNYELIVKPDSTRVWQKINKP